MNQMPASIELYLTEARFTATEIAILRHMLEDKAMSLRQLAGKTGRSTGVLNQAMHKLLNKKIIQKEFINDAPRYVLSSLHPIIQWVQEDLRQKRETLARKYQNFEAFVANLEMERTRPEMKYYEGWEGLKQAYKKLLETKEEIVGLIPVAYAESEDPLRDFRVDFFRERRRRGMFMRVIAHDTALGRRYEYRDHFEYRKTLLVPEKEYPFGCEKLVANGTLLILDYKQQRACIIHHPEMAQTERAMFDKLWSEELCRQQGKCDVPAGLQKAPTPVSPLTKAGSNAREFFLSRASLYTIGVFALIAAVMTYGLYLHSYRQNTERIREQARSIAIAAAPRFDASDLDQLHTLEDITKPEYAKVIKELNVVRWQQTNIRYAYILRPTDKSTVWEFVADADSMDPFAKIDLDHDGQITEADALHHPGEAYEWAGGEAATKKLMAGNAYADPEPYTDQWGTWFSGAAPVHRNDGTIAGIVIVDISANEISRMTAKTFAPLLYFFALFLFFMLVRFSAANRQLMIEIFQLLRERKILIALGSSLVLALVATVALRTYTNALNLKRIQDRVKSIAITAGALLHPEELDALQAEEDWKKPEWAKVVNTLRDIRLMNEDITFVYLFRKSSANPETGVFITDSHSLNPYANTDDDPTNDVDVDSNGKIEPENGDKLQWPGQIYETPPPEGIAAYNGPTASKPYEDAFGTFISGYAPLQANDGHIAGIIAVDVKTSKLADLGPSVLQIIQYFVGFVLFFFVAVLTLLNPSLMISFICGLRDSKIIRIIIISTLSSLVITYGIFIFTMQREKIRIGERLRSIASTATFQFDVADLEKLQKAGDMKTYIYQKVFMKLNEIRDANPDITYIYIMRPTQQKNLWEFVADADSNYNVPFYTDTNNDGILTGADDQNIYPGLPYASSETLLKGLNEPYVDINVKDQWGSFIVGNAPIHAKDGKPYGVLEAAISTTKAFELMQMIRPLKSFFSIIFTILTLLQLFIRQSKKNT